MRRYRIFLFDWDSTGDLLNLEINEDWDEVVKVNHRNNREQMIERLTRQYGDSDIETKLENLQAIGGQAFSVIAYHNKFYKQAREAFIMGAYYPALTAACALGERILNHLILGLRDNYKGKPGYKEFAKVKSSSNWRRMIPTLEEWGVLLPSVVTEFRALLELRQRAIHFNPETVERDREMAMEALKHLDEIIAVQFGAFRLQPWFIPDARGVQFIRKDWETNPFVKLIYLPVSLLVGPDHRIEIKDDVWTIYDEDEYEDKSVSDEEYIRLYEEFTRRRFDQLRSADDADADHT
jgi:hypothetical protein